MKKIRAYVDYVKKIDYEYFNEEEGESLKDYTYFEYIAILKDED